MKKVIRIDKLKLPVTIVMILALLTAGLFLSQQETKAASRTVTHYKFITAVVFVWGDVTKPGSWDPAAPGQTYTRKTNTSLAAGAKNIRIYPYDKNSSSFNLDTTLNVEGRRDKTSYDKEYYPYAVTQFSGSANGSVSSGKLDYTWTITLKEKERLYDVKQSLLFGQQQEIIDLMGGYVTPEMEKFLEEKDRDIGNDIAGYLYFVPYIIQYDLEEELPLTLNAELSLPPSVNLGNQYIAKDATVLPQGAVVKNTVLEKDEGKGYVQVKGWKGDKVGGSITEKASAEGSIKYRLTVNLKSGESDTDIKTISVSDLADVKVDAVLGLPPWTFEGHPALAEDRSIFIVNGEEYSAKRAYMEKLATNRFSILESGAGNTRKLSETENHVTFDQAGNYNVQLKVTPKSGGGAYDTKPIEVRKTPNIQAVLGGTQKENRKQVLHVKTATHPKHPLKEMWISLENMEDEKDKVILHHNLDGKKNTLSNSDTIKTRAVAGQPSDEYFTICKLEFLTKNRDTVQYKYTVYVKDSRGVWDQVEEEFTVRPDLAPEGRISTEASFLREPGSDTAVIEIEDRSASDGDQLERTWLIDLGGGTYKRAEELSGFKDLSFGSKQSISFNKKGVGKVNIQLKLKDVWTEETLPEYITEADYLTGEAEAITEVINVAPVVSLEPLKMKKADILILTAGQEDTQKMQEQAGAIRAKLIESGIDSKVRVQKMDTPSNIKGVESRFLLDQPYSYNTIHSFLEENSFIVDNENLYTIEGSFTDGESFADYPYTVKGFKASTGEQIWSYTIPKGGLLEMIDVRINQDDEGKYLFLTAKGKTLILEKHTGAALTVLPYEVKQCFVNQRIIYDVQSDGIFSINTETGVRTKVYNGNASGGRRIHGKLHFLSWGGNRLYRGAMDLTTNEVKLYTLPGTDGDTPGMQYTLAGVDAEGKLIVASSDGGAKVYSRDNQLLMSHKRNGAIVTPVYNEGGVCRYVCFTDETRGSSYKYHSVTIRGVYDNFSAFKEEQSKNDYLTTPRVPFARELDGTVYVITGAEYAYTYYQGYSPYPQRAKLWTFKPPSGTAAFGNSNLTKLGNILEYGRHSDMYSALHTGDNNKNYGGTRGSMTEVVTWGQGRDEILSRHLNKYLSTSGGLQGVVFYDTNSGGKETMEETIRLLNKFDCAVIGVDGGNSPYVDKITEQTVGRLISEGADLAEGIAESFKVKEDQGKSVLNIKNVTDKKGTISKSFSLLPSKTYYYEYEMKEITEADGTGEGGTDSPTAGGKSGDVLNVKFKRDSVLPDSTFKSDGWKVTEAYFEDFNGSEFNPFFKLNKEKVSGGWYRGAQLSGSVKENTYRTTEDTIYFTVPKGKKAVLSFDYDLYMGGTQMWNANGFWIDGERWKQFMPRTMKGHYMHPDILSEGEHSLYMFAAEYSTSFYCYTALDNLQVAFIEPGKSDDIKIEGGAGTVSSAGDGWIQVKGSVDSPGKTLGFKEMAGEYVTGKFGDARYTTGDYSNRERPAISIKIPDGRTAIYTGVDTRLRSNDKVCSISWGSYSWQCKGTDKRQEARNYIPSGDYRINLPPITGTQRISGNGNANRGANVYIDSMEMALVSIPNVLTEQRRFFLAPAPGSSISDKKIYVENDVYAGNGTVTFHVDPGKEYQIRSFKVYSIENGRKAYMSENEFQSSSDLAKWDTSNVEAGIIRAISQEEEARSLVYKKGELVTYRVFYSDYEGDPSKKQYWRYTHTPFNDGPHPEAAVILNEAGKPLSVQTKILDRPINQFYIDGKYTVEHWQEDDTTRGAVSGGNSDYDKLSNTASITFYIDGTANAPWVTSIKTVPAKVSEGDKYKIQVTVDDIEKDVLRLDTEIYKDGKMIHSHRKTNIKADASGKYPAVLTDYAPSASPGKYEVVCTVRDDTGAGVDSYKFTVVSAGKVSGWVNHTGQWDENRRRYNMARFNEEVNRTVNFNDYAKEKAPRKRGTNVFWSGEQFDLRAEAAGKPVSVTAQIIGYSDYKVTMNSSGKSNAGGETIYTASMWDKSMINKWGRKTPEQLTFRFTAKYETDEGTLTKTHDVPVIADSEVDYWQLHRLW